MESNLKEEAVTPIACQVKNGFGVVDGSIETKVLDDGKGSASVRRVPKQEVKGISPRPLSSVERNNDQEATGGRRRPGPGKCDTRFAEHGMKSFRNTQTQMLEGNKGTLKLEKGDSEPLAKNGKQNFRRHDNGVPHKHSMDGQKKKEESKFKMPAKDQIESLNENSARSLGKSGKHSLTREDTEHDGCQEVTKSTEISTGLIQFGNVSTNFAAHEGLEVDDLEYAVSDYKGAQQDFTSRVHQLPPAKQQQQDTGKSFISYVSRPAKHKTNIREMDISGGTSVLSHGKAKTIVDEQETVHASTRPKHDEGPKLERRKTDDSSKTESHAPNKNDSGFSSKERPEVSIGKDKSLVKRRRLADSQQTVGMQLETSHKETKGAGDILGSRFLEKMKKGTVDSDEHLPLVKRARARGQGEYSKAVSEDQSPVPYEEKQSSQVQELYESAEKVKLNRNAVSDFKSFAAEEQLQQSEGRNTKIEETGQGSLPLKADKHRIRSSLFDGEAALPPSKRRQRALEAMTACVAEAASVETDKPLDKVRHGDIEADHYSSSSPAKQSAVIGGIVTHVRADNENETVSDGSPVSRKSVGVRQNTDDVAIEMSGRESSPKDVDVSLGFHHSELVAEMETVTLWKGTDSGDANKLYSPKVEGKPKGKNQNLISANEAITISALRHSSGVESMSATKVSESSTREPTFTSAPRIGVASLQLKESDLQAKVSSFTSQEVGKRSNGGSPSFQLEEKDKNVREAYEAAKEVKQRMFLKEKDSSLLSTSMKYLIAAAQAKRTIRSSQGAVDLVPQESEKLSVVLAASPSSTYERGNIRLASPVYQYPVYHQPDSLPVNEAGACAEKLKVNASGDKREAFQTGYRYAEPREDTSKGALSYEEQEAAIARDTLEGMLETLSRTRDSIGRVTRHAIDCAKFGIAQQVVEVIVRKLEDEHSFRRRVDLFFLLDSITQCSVKEKGAAGAAYPPVVQAALPRLLKAAAPAGNGARENRRQCLKVLNLWLERNIMPAQVIREFMHGIEAHDVDKGLVSMGPRPSRNERAIDDPLREMEGIVDEYGSNAGYALPGFFVPRIFDDDDEVSESVQKIDKGRDVHDIMNFHELGDDKDEKLEQSGKSFMTNDSKGTQNEVGRHRHVLEDVDGELEMEDVSPIAEDVTSQEEQLEDSSPWSRAVGITVSSTEKLSQPPLPSAVPPSPVRPPPSPPPLPPLPMSPPPSPPPPPPSSPPPSIMGAQLPISDNRFTSIPFMIKSVPSQQTFNLLPALGAPSMFSNFEQVRPAGSVLTRFETAFDHYPQQHLIPGLMQPSIQTCTPNIAVEGTFTSPPNFVVPQIPPKLNFTPQFSSSYNLISDPQTPLPSITPLVQTLQLENGGSLQQRYVFPPLPSPQLQGKTCGNAGEVSYRAQQLWSAVLPPLGLEKEQVIMQRVQDQQWEALHQEHGRENAEDQICISNDASQGVVSSKSMMEGENSGAVFHSVVYQPTGSNRYPPEIVNGFAGSRQSQTFQSVQPGLPLPAVSGPVPWAPYVGRSNMEPVLPQVAGLSGGLPDDKSAPITPAQLQLPGYRATISSSNLWRPL
ncbi:hypothetical protein O6H91_02G086200 [Diphasiastrum complanatum]|nr:hypothetical protein O6H91_02G086200 [Diphasiastrum complanatum]